MEDYSKLVIELYREQFLAYTVGLPVNVDSIFSVQDCLLKAIDKAKVNNEPTDYLVNLKMKLIFEVPNSKIMNNAEANRPIANRFFEAFDALVAMGKIKA